MSESSTPQTLGQRIDAVLNPLYQEAEKHRASLNEAQQQIATLQQQVSDATAGLQQIESRMVEVVRSLAEQDPVLAAVVSGDAMDTVIPAEPAAEATPSPAEEAVAEAPAETPTPEPAAPTVEAAPATEAVITQTAESSAPTAENEAPAVSEPAETPAPKPAADSAVVEDGEPVPLDLSPEVDQAMVDEASALLASTTPEPEAAAEPEAQAAAEPEAAEPEAADDELPTDIAAAAERAAAAAKQLREKAPSAG